MRAGAPGHGMRSWRRRRTDAEDLAEVELHLETKISVRGRFLSWSGISSTANLEMRTPDGASLLSYFTLGQHNSPRGQQHNAL